MDSKTFVAWLQLAIAALFVWRAVSDRRAGRPAWRSAIILAVNSAGLGLTMLGSGWLRIVGWGMVAVGSSLLLAAMFTGRERGGWWTALIFGVFALPIALVELRFDDLNGWQWALFAAMAVVFTALIVMMAVRLVRSYRHIGAPTA